MFNCKIIADSISPHSRRLTTMEVTYPRFIHSELMTHRMFARNAASSRAIPWHKMMKRIEEDPVIPIYWGAEQKGMQTGEAVDDPSTAETIWLEARDNAVKSAKALAELGVHKSLVNRLTEPFMNITVIITATEWANFFRLRVHPDAECHMQKIATMMQESLVTSEPTELGFGEWHLPYINEVEKENILGDSRLLENYKRASTARCARVSYLTHDGESPSLANDLNLFNKLVTGSGFGHYSPMEHPAQCATGDVVSGPFHGWLQFRKFFAKENVSV